MNTPPSFNEAPHLCATCDNLFDCDWRNCVKPDYAEFVSQPFEKTDITKRYQFLIDERCYKCEKYKKDVDIPIRRIIKSTSNKPVIAIKDGVETEFESVRVAGEKLNIVFRNIARCLNGYSKKTGGYEWRYAESEVTI